MIGHLFSLVMGPTLEGCISGLDNMSDGKMSSEERSAARKICERALRNLAEGETTTAAMTQYSKAGLDWTVPPLEGNEDDWVIIPQWITLGSE